MILSHSPAKILGQFLVNHGIGTWQSSGGSWPITVAALPADIPDNRIALFTSLSEVVGVNMRTGETIEYPVVQIRTRSQTENVAYSKMAAIQQALEALSPGASEEINLTSPTFSVMLEGAHVTLPIFNMQGVEEQNKRFHYVLSVKLTFGES